MPMALLELETQSGATCYIDAQRVEAVMEDLNGSRIRTHSGVVYHVSQPPGEVLGKLDRALSHLDGYFNSEPCVSD